MVCDRRRKEKVRILQLFYGVRLHSMCVSANIIFNKPFLFTLTIKLDHLKKKYLKIIIEKLGFFRWYFVTMNYWLDNWNKQDQ
jgi:hypothetical protein